MISKYWQTCPVTFGSGALKRLPMIMRETGITRPVIVTGPSVSKTAGFESLKMLLAEEKTEYCIYDKMKMDAPDTLCTEAADLGMAFDADGVIAFGGGSCLDAGKAVAVLCANPEQKILELITGTPFKNRALPMILIPTTAGTGSENTIFAVISCSADGRKRSLFVSANAAIVDPELTLSTPASVTAFTGMDALAHAVEAYTSIRPGPHSDMMSLDAIRRLVKWLPVACREPENLTARENLALASNLAGIAFNNASTHIGHAVAHAIGAVHHVPHGIACAWATPEVLKLMAKYLPERARDLADALGIPVPENEAENVLGRRLAEGVRRLMKELSIPDTAAFGLDAEKMAPCGDYAVTEKLRGLCGAPVTDDEVRQILVNCAEEY